MTFVCFVCDGGGEWKWTCIMYTWLFTYTYKKYNIIKYKHYCCILRNIFLKMKSKCLYPTIGTNLLIISLVKFLIKNTINATTNVCLSIKKYTIK